MRYITVVILLVTIFTFTACGNNDTPATTRTPSTTTPSADDGQPFVPDVSDVGGISDVGVSDDSIITSGTPLAPAADDSSASLTEFWIELSGARYYMGDPISAFLDVTTPRSESDQSAMGDEVRPNRSSSWVDFRINDSEGYLGITVFNPTDAEIPFDEGVLESVRIRRSTGRGIDIVFSVDLEFWDDNTRADRDDIIAMFGEPDDVRERSAYENLIYGTRNQTISFSVQTSTDGYGAWIGFEMSARP